MKRESTLFWTVFLLSLLVLPGAPSIQAQSEPPQDEQSVMVGRVTHVEGKLLRYVPDEQDWVAVVKDAPFGFDDALYSEGSARAEFVMPNGMWVRIGGDTQIQMIALDEGVTEIDVASGTARFYNQNSAGIVKATTPFGYVTAPPNTSFDLYVGNDSAEVVALDGRVDFVQDNYGTRYEVTAGSSALLADSQRVTSTELYVDADWDGWNRQRDELWAERTQVAGDSVEYLPPQLQHDAYVLENNGRWDRVQYEGEYRYFWRPTRVAAGWAPFTMGRWTMWYGDNCWIPAEPFGYLTHHYGSWVFAGGFWYWAPPVTRIGVRIGPAIPLLPIPFAWYPGRVGWIYSGVRIGWVPLAPFEPFYATRLWGPRVVVVRNVANINIRVGNFRYLDHAIIINQNNFYRVNTYGNVRIRNINNATLINNFRAAGVVNNNVIKNFDKNPHRFNFSNTRVELKPHRTTVDRIQRNKAIAQRNVNVTAQSIRSNTNKAKLGTPAQRARIAPPTVKSKLVPANQVNKPVNQVNFREKQIKRQPKAPVVSTQPTQRKQPTKPPTGSVKQKGKKSGPAQQPGFQQSGKKQQKPAGAKVQPVPKQGQAKSPTGSVKQKGKQAGPAQQPGSYKSGKSQQVGPAKKAQKPIAGQQKQPAQKTRKAPPTAQPGKAKQAGQQKAKSPQELEAEKRAAQGLSGPQGRPGAQKPPGQPNR